MAAWPLCRAWSHGGQLGPEAFQSELLEGIRMDCDPEVTVPGPPWRKHPSLPMAQLYRGSLTSTSPLSSVQVWMGSSVFRSWEEGDLNARAVTCQLGVLGQVILYLCLRIPAVVPAPLMWPAAKFMAKLWPVCW